MPTAAPRKTHRIPHRPPFECIALLLQGGGALGAYQAGVYEALAEAGIHPDWVAGISIGAINAAIVAGNPPENRVEKLRQFWEHITTDVFGNLSQGFLTPWMKGDGDIELSSRRGEITAYIVVRVPDDLTLEQAHEVETELENEIQRSVPDLRHAIVRARA